MFEEKRLLMVTLHPFNATIGELVRVRQSFKASIDLEKAYDQSYRNSCSSEYIYLEEDETFFKNVVNALMDRLPNRRHAVLEIGPFGVGKSLLDIVRGDLFSTPSNHIVLDKLPNSFWKEQIEELTSQAGYLVIYLAGAHPDVRSQLDRALIQALQKALPTDIRLASQYEHAKAWLDDVKNPGGQQSELRPAFEQRLSRLSTSGQPWTIAQIETGLQQREPNALDAFLQTFEAIIRWPLNAFGATTAEGVYEEIRTAHTGIGRRFSGILIFFDEFAQWAKTALPGDISTLQTFVDWVNRSHRVAIVMSSQVRPIHQGSGYNELETLLGRTHEIPFRRTSYTNLLCGALERSLPYAPIDSNPDWTHLIALHQELFSEDNMPSQHVRGYYPFHPATVKALTPLADQLGQHERSIMHYLSSIEDEASFGHFLRGPLFEDDRATLRLLTLDRLFRYFAPRIKEDRPHVYNHYEQAIAAVADKLGFRLIQSLAVCDVLEAAVPVAPTEEGLARLLNLPGDPESRAALSQILESLIDAELISINPQGYYRLSASGGLTLPAVKRATNQRKQELLRSTYSVGSVDAIQFVEQSTQMASALRSHGFSIPADKGDWPFGKDMKGKVRKIESAQYANRFKISHSFEVQLISWKQLLDRHARVIKEPSTAEYKAIFVVIATDSDTQPQELDKARQTAHELARLGMSVGIPLVPFALSDAILDVIAAGQVIHQQSYRGSPVAEQARDQYQKRLLEAIASEVSVGAFEWYTPDLQVGDRPLSTNDLVEVADRAAMHLGSRCPAGITLPGLIGPGTKTDVVDALLRARNIQIPRRSTKRRDSILREALRAIGLIEVNAMGTMAQDDIANVIEPDPNHADTRAIWDLLDATIGSGGDGSAIAKVINQLSQIPYWLPQDLAKYIVAAFVGFRNLQFYSLRTNDLVPCDATTLNKAWDEPTSYSLRAVHRIDLPVEVRVLLRDIWSVIKETLPAKMHWTEIKNATYLTEEQVDALATDIHTWDTEVGQKVREYCRRFDLDMPAPIRQWLDFLAELADNRLVRNVGETYTVTLPERLTENQANPSNISGTLDRQMRRLNEIVKSENMIIRADNARRDLGRTSPLVSAWNTFCSKPLDDVCLRDLESALMALTAEMRSTSRQAPIAETQPKAPTQAQTVSDDAAKPSTVREVSADFLKVTGTVALGEDCKQQNNWETSAALIARHSINAEALRRCIEVVQTLVAQYEPNEQNISGELILTRIMNALRGEDL
jgi:hypothetical protein